MRMPGIVLLLFVVVATMAYPRAQSPAQNSRPTETTAATAHSATSDAWRYSQRSPFFEMLPEAIQSLETSVPETTAGKICAELGGTVGMIEPLKPGAETIGFVCRFAEPDVTMSVDFGELDRISTN